LILTTATLLFAGLGFADDKVFEGSASIEGWEMYNQERIPVLQFNITPELEALAKDIRPELTVVEENGDVRFQLSHSTPFGRRVFANVTSSDFGDGMTKVTMTHIADGKMTTFLTRNEQLVSSSLTSSKEQSFGDLDLQSLLKNDPSLELCVPCIWWAATGIGAAGACAAGIIGAYGLCQAQCPAGVASFGAGNCGNGFTCDCFQEVKE